MRGSDNPKIVNYKIRAFIEKIRDNLKNYEPASIATMATVSQKASQIDRMEITLS